MAFDPATAYVGDYQWLEFVEDVTWEHDGATTTGLKGRWDTTDSPDVASMAAGLGLSSDAAAVVVWQPKPADEGDAWLPTFAPKSGHILRRDDTGEGWLIVSVTRSRFNNWTLLCQREITNA